MMVPGAQMPGIAVSAVAAFTKKHLFQVRNQYCRLHNAAVLSISGSRQQHQRFNSSNPDWSTFNPPPPTTSDPAWSTFNPPPPTTSNPDWTTFNPPPPTTSDPAWSTFNPPPPTTSAGLSPNASVSSQLRVVSLLMRNSPARRGRWFSATIGSPVNDQKMCRMFSTVHSSLFQQSCSTGRPLPQVATPQPESHLGEVPLQHRAFKGLETNFPCLSRVKDSGPEPDYDNITKGYKLFVHQQPFSLKLNDGVLPQLQVAYETWGQLNEDASNAVLVLAGLSASSHARSSVDNMNPGWWEKFIGPGCAVDTSKFFVICPNNLGSCYGTSGPSTVNVLTGKPYATTFPIIGVEDMTNAIYFLLDHLGIKKLYASVGSSLGGMLSLQSVVTNPERVGRLVTISACAQSHPSSIAMRYLQRKCIMCDPSWNNGHYYGQAYPKVGMKLAREIATITYRSGPEWNQRFGRNRISDDPPSLCPTFLIESYLEHQGESFSTKYDPNSLLYISKAMDMFDIAEGYSSLEEGLSRVKCPSMVIGVQTDMLFPVWQQRELSNLLQKSGNEQVTFYELNSLYGHDTFLLDLNGVGAAVKGFLETEQRQTGWLTKHRV